VFPRKRSMNRPGGVFLGNSPPATCGEDTTTNSGGQPSSAAENIGGSRNPPQGTTPAVRHGDKSTPPEKTELGESSPLRGAIH